MMRKIILIMLAALVQYTGYARMKDITAQQFINNVNVGCVGYNIGNTLDSWSKGNEKFGKPNMHQETLWGERKLTQADFDRLKDLGFTTVRIPVTWYYNTYYDTNGKLHIYKEWINRVKEVVDYAMKDGLSVIINAHFDCEAKNAIFVGATDEKMDSVRNYSRQLWTIIANYFKKYDEHLVFEAYNEPAPYPGWYYKHEFCVQMNQLNQLFVDVVRGSGGNNKKRIIIVPTLLNGMGFGFFSDFVMPKDVVRNKIIVEIHDYNTRFDQSLEESFTKADEFSKRIGVPLIIGEFASNVKYAFPEYRTYHIQNFVARFRAHGMAGCYWDDGNLGNFGLISRRKNDSTYGQMNITMLNALRNPVKYETLGKVTFDKYSQFQYVSMTDSAAIVPNDSWCVGKYCSVSLLKHITVTHGCHYMYFTVDAENDAHDYVVKKYAFYDKNMCLVKINNYKTQGANTIMCEVPIGAAYMNISLSKRWGECHTTAAGYQKYFDNGDISVGVTFLDRDPRKSLKAVK